MLNAARIIPLALAAGMVSAPPSAQTPVIADKQAEVAGYRLHYLEAGAGPPLVLVHGLGADVRTWRSAIPALSSTFHVYAIDLLGFGRSDKPQIPYRIGTLVESLTGFLDAVGVDKTSIVGNSLGGWVATMFATVHPDRLTKLVLVDSAGYGEDPAQMVRDYLSQFDPATVATAERLLSSMNPEDQRKVEAAAVAYFARRFSRDDGYAVAALVESIMRGEDTLGPEVKNIRSPTLVVWGRNDPVIPLRVGQTLAQDIPNARAIVLDGCGHRPQTECAPAFNRAVEEFLRSTP
jgi:pimeloyl-ACP methyl ester carboxylesterase